MSYPKMKGKHSETPIITPKEYVRYSKKVGITPLQMPTNIVLCFSERLIDSLQERHELKVVSGIYDHSTTKLCSVGGTNGRVGILSNFGIGAPATVLHMEELIAWGAKRFVVLGTAGGINADLQAGDVVVCTKSIRDEGTSHHYTKNTRYSSASRELTDALFEAFSKDVRRLYKGPSWTIDAPYRETVKELIHYRSEGVMTVEMEASAVFAVGQIRGVETSAVFVISDLLTENGWKPSIHSATVLAKLVIVFQSVRKVLAI
ncbi:MAG: nucleoside phosphorylase [Nitrososphaerales archaeon]